MGGSSYRRPCRIEPMPPLREEERKLREPNQGGGAEVTGAEPNIYFFSPLCSAHQTQYLPTNKEKLTVLSLSQWKLYLGEGFENVEACGVLMGNCWFRGNPSIYRVSSNAKSESPRVQSPVKEEEEEGSKLPSNPKEVEDLRWDTAANPLVPFTFDELKIITGNFRQDFLGWRGFWKCL